MLGAIDGCSGESLRTGGRSSSRFGRSCSSSGGRRELARDVTGAVSDFCAAARSAWSAWSAWRSWSHAWRCACARERGSSARDRAQLMLEIGLLHKMFYILQFHKGQRSLLYTAGRAWKPALFVFASCSTPRSPRIRARGHAQMPTASPQSLRNEKTLGCQWQKGRSARARSQSDKGALASIFPAVEPWAQDGSSIPKEV